MPVQSLVQGHYLTLSLVRRKRTDVWKNLVGGVPAWKLDDVGKMSSRLWEAKFHFGMPKKNVKIFIFSDDTHYIIRSNPVGLK